jgi:hypothetical protein
MQLDTPVGLFAQTLVALEALCLIQAAMGAAMTIQQHWNRLDNVNLLLQGFSTRPLVRQS